MNSLQGYTSVTSYVLFGIAEGHRTVKESTDILRDALTDEQWDEEVKRRTIFVVLDYTDVKLEEVVGQHRTQTTFFKKWYNDKKIAKLTETDVAKILSELPDDKKIVVSVRSLLDETRRGKTEEEKQKAARAKTVEAIKTATDPLAEFKRLAAEAGISLETLIAKHAK